MKQEIKIIPPRIVLTLSPNYRVIGNPLHVISTWDLGPRCNGIKLVASYGPDAPSGEDNFNLMVAMATGGLPRCQGFTSSYMKKGKACCIFNYIIRPDLLFNWTVILKRWQLKWIRKISMLYIEKWMLLKYVCWRTKVKFKSIYFK